MANVKASDNREKQTPPRSYFRRATDIYSVWCWLTVRGCTVSVKDFLKQRAVNISVGGHYTLANWFDSQGKPRTFACRTSRVSPFRMLVAVPVVGKVGDQRPHLGPTKQSRHGPRATQRQLRSAQQPV